MSGILFIEHDLLIGASYTSLLEAESFSVTLARTAAAGLNQLQQGAFALVLLDAMLPERRSLDVLRDIRRLNQIPVIMLASHEDASDSVLALELGADDYVGKTCAPRELAARLRAVLRRVRVEAVGSITPVVIGPLELLTSKRQVNWRGSPLTLTSTEFSLLYLLAKNAGHVVSKKTLSEFALGRTLTRHDRSIDVHLSSIRQKLGNRPDGRFWIETIRGLGYQFVRD